MEKKRIKTQQLALLLVFLVVIALPGALLFNDPGRYLAGDNRMAAPFPELVKDDGSLAARSEFEAFFDDNIGFRTAAPLLDTMVMYTVFGSLLDTDQLPGKEGNLFAGGNRHFPEYRAPYTPLTEEELAENGRNIEAAADWFESRGIPFMFITIPDKEGVYPGLYPDTFVQRPDRGRLSQQVDWLRANTGVDAYDMTQALREKASASDGMIWYETNDNAHWNCLGAWYGYLEIMDRLKAYDADIRTLSIDDFDVSVRTEPYVNWNGVYAFPGLYNTVYTFDYRPGFSYEHIGNSTDPWMPQDQLDIAGFEKGGVYFHFHNDRQDGTLVFFGDSYIYQFLLPYFSESFSDVYLFHLPTNYQIMRPILDMIGADYVVLEMVERTYGMTNIDLMAEEFAADVPVLILPEDYPGPPRGSRG